MALFFQYFENDPKDFFYDLINSIRNKILIKKLEQNT